MSVTFDTWRERYDRMTFREHQDFNSELAVLYPVQRSFDPTAAHKFLSTRNPRQVVEIGGWDGALAAQMLELFPDIKTWVNYDITPNVPQVCDDRRYHRVVLVDWPWKCSIRGDALIASHVFEHMRMQEVVDTLSRWDVPSVYADVPITSPTGWSGYNGTHILEVGAGDFLERVQSIGFAVDVWRLNGEGLIAFLDR